MVSFGNIQGWLYGGAIAELKGFAAGIDPFKLIGAVAIAAVFGMVHALMPGHGKTAIVSYYLGRPAKMLSSIGTSTVLVLTHVGSAVVLVLTGFIVIQRTIGGAGRAPAFELASAVLIVAMGHGFCCGRCVRTTTQKHRPMVGGVLAFVTGLAPCPLTTFIMVYALTNGFVAAGLLVTMGMAAGMVVTITLFAIAAIVMRDRFLDLAARTHHARQRLGRGLELISAAASSLLGRGCW
jgi:ABC-type nickel/cobalt efflux system permease component RcnA